MNFRTVLQAGFVILVLTGICASQMPFQVNNPRHQDWPQSEARLIFESEARNLAAEFKLPQPPFAVFTLVLGAKDNSVDVNRKQLRLKKWDKFLYAEGVFRLTFDQMLSTESKIRLARRALAESEASVDWREAETSNPIIEMSQR